MSPEERAQKIESYGKAYQNLTSALKQYPREMWQFKPAPEEWSIHEILVHIADSEAHSYTRCRRFIVEPGSLVVGYDQERWASELNYHDQSVEDALELFMVLRHMTYLLIRKLPDSVWLNTVEHSENGTITLEDWLKAYESHIPAHIQQMQSTYQAWLKRKGTN